ncbi:DUF2892 domain-containing protein [Granulosicoccaceae sp. 1_MG-2023]|nr:DUF2892 domain-containing protein [Granulosicoccaceae sp. 1_MG-2023]
MNLDRVVLAFGGAVVLVSVLLAVYVNLNWLWLTGFVGLNLLQASFTGFCPLASILAKFGVSAGSAFNPGAKS